MLENAFTNYILDKTPLPIFIYVDIAAGKYTQKSNCTYKIKFKYEYLEYNEEEYYFEA